LDLLSVRVLVLPSIVDHLFEACARSIQAPDLSEDVLAVVVRHFHALVEVAEGRVRHLQGLHRDRRGTSKVGAIGLSFEDGLLSLLDLMFLLQLLQHGLQEEELLLLLLDLLVDFLVDLVHDALLEKLVACDISHLLPHLEELTLEDNFMLDVGSLAVEIGNLRELSDDLNILEALAPDVPLVPLLNPLADELNAAFVVGHQVLLLSF